MPIAINEVEVIAPPSDREGILNTAPDDLPPADLTPRDIYWVTRKLIERQMRLRAS